ncbi:unnamed protein product, partial [Polarella glacialis]
DTDAGVDDAVALCMALKLAEKSGVEMKLITTCFGNCSVNQVGVNVAKCLVACSPGSEVRGPRIVRGASHCLRGENYGQDAWFCLTWLQLRLFLLFVLLLVLLFAVVLLILFLF